MFIFFSFCFVNPSCLTIPSVYSQEVESKLNREVVVVIVVVRVSLVSASATVSVNSSVPIGVASVPVTVAARFVIEGLLPINKNHYTSI